jgi:hypothetical protein
MAFDERVSHSRFPGWTTLIEGLGNRCSLVRHLVSDWIGITGRIVCLWDWYIYSNRNGVESDRA